MTTAVPTPPPASHTAADRRSRRRVGENWSTEAPLDEWRRVEVDGRGRAAGLDLCAHNLRGTLPPELGSMMRRIRGCLAAALVTVAWSFGCGHGGTPETWSLAARQPLQRDPVRIWPACRTAATATTWARCRGLPPPPHDPGRFSCGAALTRKASLTWTPPSSSLPRPRFQARSAPIGSLDRPPTVANSSPSTSRCLRWPTATAVRRSSSSSRCSRGGPRHSPASPSPARVPPPRSTPTPTVPWPFYSIRVTGQVRGILRDLPQADADISPRPSSGSRQSRRALQPWDSRCRSLESVKTRQLAT